VTRAVPVTGVCSGHDEGPGWPAGWPGLRWAGMLAGDLLTLGPDGG
jgi:hypothetical protein